jgi:hypothetical protein
MLIAIDDFSNYLRNKDKYGHEYKDIEDAIEKIREEFYNKFSKFLD